MSWVQSKSSTGTATTLTVTYTSNVSSGNTLIAYVAQDHNVTFTPSSVKDGSGNAMVQIGTTVNYPGTSGGGSVWAMNVPAGDVGTKPAITATVSATFGLTMLIQEVSGIATASTSAGFLDGTQGHNTGTASPATNGSYSTSAAGEFLVAFYGDSGTTGTLPSSLGAYTADTNNPAAQTNADIVVGYINSSSNGSQSFSWTFTGTNDWGTILGAFKSSGGGATFIAPCATIVGQGEGMTPSANTGVASAPTIYQAGRRAAFY